jgi:hypothetical protein
MVQNDADGGSRVVAKSVRPATETDFHESPIIGDRSGKRRRTSHLPAVFKVFKHTGFFLMAFSEAAVL